MKVLIFIEAISVLTIAPMFVLGAFIRGTSVLLGTLQFVFLCSAEAAQWRFTKRSGTRVKIISSIVTYLVSNFAFSLVAFILHFGLHNA